VAVVAVMAARLRCDAMRRSNPLLWPDLEPLDSALLSISDLLLMNHFNLLISCNVRAWPGAIYPESRILSSAANLLAVSRHRFAAFKS
jgi:hypothetical protein